MIEGQEQLKSYITNYYKNLFGEPDEGNFTMDESRTEDIPQVSAEGNGLLTAPYSEVEVRKAIFLIEHNKAPGPDGFPGEFYQTFWDTIRADLMALFSSLHVGKLELFRLNFGEIILLPKMNEAERIQQYRPICLLNISFNFFTKVATIRLNTVADHVVRPSQTAFMQGRNILDGVVVLHEAVHELHLKKLNWVILKLDFEKAYDKVKWSFLQQTLRMKGFSEEWRALIHNFVTGGSVAIKVNDDIGRYFQTCKGLRQGDPLSPMLFNIVVDMLAIMIEHAKVEGQIEGLLPHLVYGGLSILQYADDTILFMEHDIEKAQNLKLILASFEQLSGLKINFHKSELFFFSEAQNDAKWARSVSYLVFGDSDSLLEAHACQVEKRRRKTTKTVLTNMVLYMISFFLLPKGVLHRLDYYRSRFFWQEDSEKKKYRLVKWSVVCTPKDQGGLGIHYLQVKNTTLLGKWLYKLLTESGMWQTLLKWKYVGSKALSQVSWKQGDSHFWAGLMATKPKFFRFGIFLIKDGSQIRF
jgi:hypothetical protein